MSLYYLLLGLIPKNHHILLHLNLTLLILFFDLLYLLLYMFVLFFYLFYQPLYNLFQILLAFLYMTGELQKRRSLWMVVGFISVLACLLVSLICNFPSPL